MDLSLSPVWRQAISYEMAFWIMQQVKAPPRMVFCLPWQRLRVRPNYTSNTANSILRERPSCSKEDSTDDISTTKKSVQFHLLPLERQKKKEAQEEKKKGQCSPPRSRERPLKRAQCSPPQKSGEQRSDVKRDGVASKRQTSVGTGGIEVLVASARGATVSVAWIW